MERQRVSAEDVWLLVKKVQEGDIDAYGEIYRIHYDTVLGLTWGILGDKMTAEDAVADAFLKVLRNIRNYHPMGHEFVAVLLRAAKNVAFDIQRKAVRRPEMTLEVYEHSDLFGCTASAEEQVLRAMKDDVLWHCLRTLSDRQRECLVRRFFQGMSTAETARAMHTTVGAIKTLQYRASERLRASLQRRMI